MAINNLSNSSNILGQEVVKKSQNLTDSKELSMAHSSDGQSYGKTEVNSLLTKSVIQIIGDVLKQFNAVLPQ